MAGSQKESKAPLTQEELYKEIVEYLDINNTCTLALAYNDVPRAIPVEYANDGVELYVVSEGMSKSFYESGKKEKVLEWKRMFIDRNPKCSVGLISPYFGYESTRGLRMWGEAQIFQKGDTEWDKGIKLLKGFRGRPKADMEELEKSIVRLSQMVMDNPQSMELDINPLLAHEEGNGATVADCRIILKDLDEK